MNFSGSFVATWALLLPLLLAGCAGGGGEVASGLGNSSTVGSVSALEGMEVTTARADLPAAWPRNRVLLERAAYTDEQARAMILEIIPLGTNQENLLKEFAEHFIVFDMRVDEYNGVTFRGENARRVGEHSMWLTIDTVFAPMGLWPAVYYRWAMFAFDGDGKLLDVDVRGEIDAP